MSIDRILEGLDPQQRAAATHERGPALIVAGAGAGKTTTLVRRIAYLVRSGVDPRSILVLSFTRASAHSIMERARAFEPDARDIVGGTFHSVGHRILRDYHALFGLDRDFTMLDPADAESLFKDVIARNPSKEHRPKVGTIGKIVSFARNTQRSIEETISDRFPKYAADADFIARIADGYREAKREMHILDFDDILEFWARLCEHDRAGPGIRERFRHVTVDEHQDSNAIQLRILYAMGADGTGDRSVTAVGDPSQSIYAFRGASPGTMFDFRRRWPATKLFLIERNYRSCPEIVDAADRIDRSMTERFERRLAAVRPSAGDRPRIRTVNDSDEESEFVADCVIDKVEEGVPLHEQAVVVRSMRAARRIELRFKERRIPYRVVGGLKIHEAAHIKDVLAVLKVACNPRDGVSLARLLELFPKIGPGTARKLVDAVASQTLDGVLAGLRDEALKRTQIAPLVKAIESVDLADPAGSIRDAKRAMRSALTEGYAEDWEYREKDIEMIADLAAAFPDVGTFMETITIDVALDSKADRSAPDDVRPVTITTIHGSKGLEWKVVYLPNFVHGHLPTAFAETPEDLDEERRLFYVAVTRAKDELIIVRPAMTLVRNELMPIGSSAFESTIAPACQKDAYRRPARPQESFEIPSGFVIDGWG